MVKLDDDGPIVISASQGLKTTAPPAAAAPAAAAPAAPLAGPVARPAASHGGLGAATTGASTQAGSVISVAGLNGEDGMALGDDDGETSRSWAGSAWSSHGCLRKDVAWFVAQAARRWSLASDAPLGERPASSRRGSSRWHAAHGCRWSSFMSAPLTHAWRRA